ncbi:MAG: PDDEXK nuclease domain-containing protein [Legionellales bacterium]|nr:PDDEXK nuclease domain-containing protein [Legionellales bacterium]
MEALLIQNAREQAYKTVNTLLIDLYWRVGQYISIKIRNAEWGDGVVPELAKYIANTQPGLRGFTRVNLFRMRQFYETYCNDEIISPLVRQLPWTHNLIIMSQSKSEEERFFYINQAIRERWSKRELERQLKLALFERTILHPQKGSQSLAQSRPEAINIFKDAYMVEFLELPDGHDETDLHHGLLNKLKNFLIELGRDFCFIGSEPHLSQA